MSHFYINSPQNLPGSSFYQTSHILHVHMGCSQAYIIYMDNSFYSSPQHIYTHPPKFKNLLLHSKSYYTFENLSRYSLNTSLPEVHLLTNVIISTCVVINLCLISSSMVIIAFCIGLII